MDNRDPRKKYRYDKRGRRITTSATRSKRQQASTAPKPTSSKDRAKTKGASKKVTSGKSESALEKFKRIKRANQKLRASSGAQGPKTPPVQGPYQRATKGMLGSRGGPNKQKVPTPGTKARPASNNRRATGGGLKMSPKHQRMAAAATRLVNPRGDIPSKVGAAVALVEAATSSNSSSKTKTKMRKTPGMSKEAVAANKRDVKATNKALKAETKKFRAKSFDMAFAAARKAGKKEFTWRSKRYNTKLA